MWAIQQELKEASLLSNPVNLQTVEGSVLFPYTLSASFDKLTMFQEGLTLLDELYTLQVDQNRNHLSVSHV